MPEPDPIKSDQEPVALYVFLDLAERVATGKGKYETFLTTKNGRRPLRDAYEEALDMCMYLRQEILEREETPSRLISLKCALELKNGLMEIIHGEPTISRSPDITKMQSLQDYIEKIQDQADNLLDLLTRDVSDL